MCVQKKSIHVLNNDQRLWFIHGHVNGAWSGRAPVMSLTAFTNSRLCFPAYHCTVSTRSSASSTSLQRWKQGGKSSQHPHMRHKIVTSLRLCLFFFEWVFEWSRGSVEESVDSTVTLTIVRVVEGPLQAESSSAVRTSHRRVCVLLLVVVVVEVIQSHLFFFCPRQKALKRAQTKPAFPAVAAVRCAAWWRSMLNNEPKGHAGSFICWRVS